MTAFPPQQQTGAANRAGRQDLGRQVPTRSNSRVLIVTVIAVLVIGGGLSAWLLASPSYDRATAEGTAEAFADALNSSNVDAAKELVCSQDRRELTQSGITSIGSVSVSVDKVETKGKQATATLTMTANVAGTSLGSQKIPLPLTQSGDGDQWEVCGLSGDIVGLGN